jgi:hypothetical protein
MALIKWIYLVFRTILSALALIPIVIWRVKFLRYGLLLLVAAGLVVSYLFYGRLPAPVTTFDVIWLQQGWTEDQRQKYYQTDQGTLIMPYSWFMSLEMPPTLTNLLDNTTLFRSDDNVSRYRLIPDPRPKYNPDRLPIGVTKTIVPDDLVYLGLDHKEWLSFSCAACHTGQLTYKGLAIRIDGMPAMWDFSYFSQNMTGALAATRLLPTKFDRFAAKVLQREGKPDNSEEREKLKRQIDEYTRWPLIKDAIRAIRKDTYPTTEGPGRTDALGRGGNGQFAILDDANIREGNAPVSFPPLWYTHEYDWVQSTTGIRQPLGRNVTESWGVNVVVDIEADDPAKLFRSTHPLEKLFWIETLLSVLEHPRWPDQIFGPINEQLAERGRYLYEEAIWDNPRNPRDELLCGGDTGVPCNEERIAKQVGYCARCHSPVREAVNLGATPPCTPETDPNCKSDPALWQLPLYRLDVIGTDPNDARNFNARVGTLSPGKGTFRTAFAQSPFAVPSKENLDFGIGNGLQFVTTNVMNWWFTRNQPLMEQWVAAGVFPNVPLGRRTMEGFRQNMYRAPLAYPARPMAGYWAAAPHLHNHSVLNMYELLSPVNERSGSFYIGNTEFEPDKLGFESGWFERGFKFDSSQPGNSNAGHEFSHKPGDPPKPGVIGPLLSADDRRAIVEYMKKIDDVPKLSPAETARRRQLLQAMRPFFEGTVDPQYKEDAPTFAPPPEEPGVTPSPSPSPSPSPVKVSSSYLEDPTRALPAAIVLMVILFIYRRTRP